MRSKLFIVLFIMLSLTVFGSRYHKVNSSIRVDAGDTVNGSVSTVNGSVTVGSNCTIDGVVKTVNGGVSIMDKCHVENVKTVNGGIRLGENNRIDGSVSSVNGSVKIKSGSTVGDDVSTVNGMIELTGTTAEKNVETVNGDIYLLKKSRLKGDIVIPERRGFQLKKSRIKIKISGGSVVEGSILVESTKNLEVKVYISKDSRVNGDIKNAEVIKE